MQWVIDNVIVSGDRDLLSTLALGFGLLMLIQQATSLLRSWALMYMGTTFNLQWRANLFTHLVRLPVQYFEKRHLGDVVSRFGSVNVIQRTITTSFLEAILDGFMAIATLIMMFVYSVSLSWIVISAMVLYIVIRLLMYAPLRHATKEQIIHSPKQESSFLQTLRGLKTIKLFQRQDERRSGWLSLLVSTINADIRGQKLHLFYQTANGFVIGLENIIVIWLGAKLIMNGGFTVGVLMAFNAYKNQFSTRLSALVDKIVEVKMLRIQAERLADIVLSEPEPTSEQVVPFSDTDKTSPIIQVRGLRYRYADQEPYVLDGLDLTIYRGESIAITGPSGCGKTTLISILLGILPVTEGEVLINRRNINKIGADPIRQMVGAVMQDDVLFAGSIADNISFFDINADHSHIKACAKAASIHSDICMMPMGYNTLVGDMGTVLSGGQKQRILLARALYKKPRILFLDEATSHLDIGCEKRVNDSIKALEITRIIVAHRPDTIANSDRVVLLSQGKVVKNIETQLLQRPRRSNISPNFKHIIMKLNTQ
jgi:ATP-binding cassette subfamily B protein RaxB